MFYDEGRICSGIEQIRRAVAEVDKVVQQAAGNTEESAGAAQEMAAEAKRMKEVVRDLANLVSGEGGRGDDLNAWEGNKGDNLLSYLPFGRNRGQSATSHYDAGDPLDTDTSGDDNSGQGHKESVSHNPLSGF